MYYAKLMGFHELETRSFFSIGTLTSFPIFDDINRHAYEFAAFVGGMADTLCQIHNCDGIAIDVYNDHGDVAVSYDLIPGRPMTAYYGDECHE